MLMQAGGEQRETQAGLWLNLNISAAYSIQIQKNQEVLRRTEALPLGTAADLLPLRGYHRATARPTRERDS